MKLCATFAIALTGSLLSAGERANANDCFVLLRNGEVIQGQIERDGDHYLVRQNGTATLRIPYKDISHVGPSLRDLYKHKANRIVEFRASEHLNLASWCLQNRLEAQTTHHILRAETLDPLHAHLPLMKARLERYMQLGDAMESSNSKIALMSAIGQEPIPFAPAPTRRPSPNRATTQNGLASHKRTGHEQNEDKQNADKQNADKQSPDERTEHRNGTTAATNDRPSASDSTFDASSAPRNEPTNEPQLTDNFVPATPSLRAPKLIPTEPPALSSVHSARILPTQPVPQFTAPKVNVDLIQGIEQSLAQAKAAKVKAAKAKAAQVAAAKLKATASQHPQPGPSPPQQLTFLPKPTKAVDRSGRSETAPNTRKKRAAVPASNAPDRNIVANNGRPTEPKQFRAPIDLPKLNRQRTRSTKISPPTSRLANSPTSEPTLDPGEHLKSLQAKPPKSRPTVQNKTVPQITTSRQPQKTETVSRPWPIEVSPSVKSQRIVKTESKATSDAPSESIVRNEPTKAIPRLPFSPAPEQRKTTISKTTRRGNVVPPAGDQRVAARANSAPRTRPQKNPTPRRPKAPIENTDKLADKESSLAKQAVAKKKTPESKPSTEQKLTSKDFISKDFVSKDFVALDLALDAAKSRAKSKLAPPTDQRPTETPPAGIRFDDQPAANVASTFAASLDDQSFDELDSSVANAPSRSERFDVTFESSATQAIMPNALTQPPHQEPLAQLVTQTTEPERTEPEVVMDVDMAPELIRAYVANLQPILLTRCAAANCHGNNTTSDFHLHNMAGHRPSRTMTMRNLAAIMTQIDPEDVINSPLATWGQTPHGDTNSKLLAITDVQQKQMLLHWIQDVVTPQTQTMPVSRDEILANRGEIFSDGAERISMRRFKDHDVRWGRTTPVSNSPSEPAQRASQSINFATRPISRQ